MNRTILSTTDHRKYSTSIFFITAIFLIVLFLSCNKNSNVVPSPEINNPFSAKLLNFTQWHYSSAPINNSISNKADAYWVTVIPSDIKLEDIIGEQSSSNPIIFDFYYNPLQKGVYNWQPSIDVSENNWGGCMITNLSTLTNVSSFINSTLDIWIKIDEAPDSAILNIDLGKISEDVIPNKKLDQEDKNFDGKLSSSEDVGIDGLPDSLEPGFSSTNEDPSGDDFKFIGYDNYQYINGSEGNIYSADVGKNPDGEDINKNGALDLVNSYYSYKLPINFNEIVKRYYPELGKNGWFKIRIPLENPDSVVGNPNLNEINTLRLWVTNAKAKVHLRFAEFKFTKM